MKCPTCGKQTEGIDHNKRGLRCTFCWARLPDEPPKPRRKRQPKAKPKARPKAKAESPKAEPQKDE